MPGTWYRLVPSKGSLGSKKARFELISSRVKVRSRSGMCYIVRHSILILLIWILFQYKLGGILNMKSIYKCFS